MFPPAAKAAVDTEFDPSPAPPPLAVDILVVVDHDVPLYNSVLVLAAGAYPPAIRAAVCDPAVMCDSAVAVFKAPPAEKEVPSNENVAVCFVPDGGIIPPNTNPAVAVPAQSTPDRALGSAFGLADQEEPFHSSTRAE